MDAGVIGVICGVIVGIVVFIALLLISSKDGSIKSISVGSAPHKLLPFIISAFY